jgi:hypothetical protein
VRLDPRGFSKDKEHQKKNTCEATSDLMPEVPDRSRTKRIVEGMCSIAAKVNFSLFQMKGSGREGSKGYSRGYSKGYSKGYNKGSLEPEIVRGIGLITCLP